MKKQLSQVLHLIVENFELTESQFYREQNIPHAKVVITIFSSKSL